MSAELEAGLSAVRNMADDPAPANDAAATDQARVEAIALAYITLSHGRFAPEAYEAKKSFWNSHAEFIIAVDPATAQLAALQAECAQLRGDIERTDRCLRRWRTAYFRDNPPNTYLANLFNDILRALGTYEQDAERNAARQSLAAQAVDETTTTEGSN